MNAAITYPPTDRRNNPAVFFLILVVLFGVALAVAAPKIIPSTHAELAHGADAFQARNTCEQYGISQVWQQKDGRYHFLCQSPSVGWFDLIVEKVNGAWKEVTAFQPKDGSLSSIVSWIKGKGCKWIDLKAFETSLR